MFKRWLWQYLLRKTALRYGFFDPVGLLSRLSNFAKPSEVMAPTELIRATALLHARGLINSQAIQHNLDWVWPYWVHQQFDPHVKSFVPRAFSLTHINLTHRNWTAVGLPDSSHLPLVDPRGLLTPFWDGWSLDAWIIDDDGNELVPAKEAHAGQTQRMDNGLQVFTHVKRAEMDLTAEAAVHRGSHGAVLRQSWQGYARSGGWLFVSLRPYNPEGVSLIQETFWNAEELFWLVNDDKKVFFRHAPDYYVTSDYHRGDVYHQKDLFEHQQREVCDIGMATAANLYRIEPGEKVRVDIAVPLEKTMEHSSLWGLEVDDPQGPWEVALEDGCTLKIPDSRMQHLYDASVRTLLLHTADDIYAGPFIYKRFWFRDAAFIIHALACLNFERPIERAIQRFPKRQTRFGYYLSQEGEWDSNGEVLWALRRYCELFDRKLDRRLYKSAMRAARWIIRKRLPDRPDSPHAGLMPPGFSAEHFGPNDYYYWDSFWSYEGLMSAAYLARQHGRQRKARVFEKKAAVLFQMIERSLAHAQQDLNSLAMPSSPYRRLDSSAIGTLISGYPLQVLAEDDERLRATVNYLYDSHLVKGSFFHDMSHSGLNPYLTLHMAQVFLRAGDDRCHELLQSIAGFASSTGHWPEAVHPNTHGGCMGDGQHVWAAAEWLMMMRNMFVREEENEDLLILASGIPAEWLTEEGIVFGPTRTRYGPVTVRIKKSGPRVVVDWDLESDSDARVEVHLLGERHKVRAGKNVFEHDLEKA